MAIKDRGFASMSKERQREIASLGGRTAHQKGTAHKWTAEEAVKAGQKGGRKSADNKAGIRVDVTAGE